jgi:hypothetical protein
MPDEQMGITDVIIDASKVLKPDEEQLISLIQVGSNPKVNKFLKVTRLTQGDGSEF